MQKPHLTPEKLIGQKFSRNTFNKMKIALVGYCPPPTVLEKYKPVQTSDQHFIHLTPKSVFTCTHNNMEFLSLEHVYGGPVSASTVEELAYYGFEYVLAYGLAGSLGVKNLKMGDYYLVENALVSDGTTPHYTREQIVCSDAFLRDKILELCCDTELKNIIPVKAVTGDAIYREYDEMLDRARERGCDIANCDSSHLFAASLNNDANRNMKTIECGVISDVVGDKNKKEWNSTLSAMLSSGNSKGINPLELTGRIVEFYVERLATEIP